MRPLEWILLLSFIPVLLVPALSTQWRRRWLFLFVPLPVGVAIIHLLIEGWRVQMIPVYVLAVLVFISRIPALRKDANPVHRRRGIAVSVLLGLCLLVCGVAAGWLLPVAKFPEPTGPYAVGVVDREVVDEARQRRLMVSVWYPAAQAGSPALMTDHPDEVAAAMEIFTGLPSLAFQHLGYFTVAATQNATLTTDDGTLPVLVFSHGMVGMRLQNSSNLQELASWGYVVVAIDHTDAAAVTVFPDGEARYYDLQRFDIPPEAEIDTAVMDTYVFPVWVADQQFIYDTLEQWNDSDSLLAGRLDLTRIGSFGHSFGGATAAEVCRVDERCRAAVIMDGGLYGGIVSQPAVSPLMLMTSADSAELPEAVGKWTNMMSNAQNAAYWLELPHSSHLSFTITELLSPFLVPDNFDPYAGLQTIDKYLRLFFDKHLRGIETADLESESGEQDVRWITNRGG